MSKKKKTGFQKVTMIFVWIMIILMVGGLILGSLISLMNN
ncbi:DUF4044 domain-containing protein [Apilactobacillus ozensis]|nr:DUF4044 domain-containing protein [Apilactobacillus ozensis]MCK8607281.1 DUF4044 domain-containing protein [Apilactobacillus ozensis]